MDTPSSSCPCLFLILTVAKYSITLLSWPFLNMQFSDSTFTLCCHHHHLPTTFVSGRIETLYSLSTNSPFSSPLLAPGNPHSTFVSISLTTLGTSYMWNHTVFDLFFWLAVLFSIISLSFIQVVAYVWISFLFNIHEWCSVVCICHICLSIPPSMDTWAASTFCLTLVFERHNSFVKTSGD